MTRDEFTVLMNDDRGGEVPLDLIRTLGFSAIVTEAEYLSDTGAGFRPVILIAVECECCDEVSLVGYLPNDAAIFGIANQLQRLGERWLGQS